MLEKMAVAAGSVFSALAPCFPLDPVFFGKKPGSVSHVEAQRSLIFSWCDNTARRSFVLSCLCRENGMTMMIPQQQLLKITGALKVSVQWRIVADDCSEN